MNLLNDGQLVPLHEIPRRAFVLVEDGRWRQLESWRVLDEVKGLPNAPRFQVCWVGTELYPSTYRNEPRWQVRVGDEGSETVRAAGVEQ